jgi:hypothetical protein
VSVSSRDVNREAEPPPGVVVMRSSELDPLFGCSDRWGYRGQINGVAVYHCGLQSHAAACLAAWGVADRG